MAVCPENIANRRKTRGKRTQTSKEYRIFLKKD